MPDPLQLNVNDLVRFTSVPTEWSNSNISVPEESRLFMNKMIRRSWPCRVTHHDETGYPYIRAVTLEKGKRVYHSWLITEHSGWRQVHRRTPKNA